MPVTIHFDHDKVPGPILARAIDRLMVSVRRYDPDATTIASGEGLSEKLREGTATTIAGAVLGTSTYGTRPHVARPGTINYGTMRGRSYCNTEIYLYDPIISADANNTRTCCNKCHEKWLQQLSKVNGWG